MQLWLRYITWVHIHAKFKEDFLNTLVIISITSLEQRRCFIEIINYLTQKKLRRYLGQSYTIYTERYIVVLGNIKR